MGRLAESQMSKPWSVAPFGKSAAARPLLTDQIRDEFRILDGPRVEVRSVAVNRRIAGNQPALEKLAHDDEGQLEVPFWLFSAELVFNVAANDPKTNPVVLGKAHQSFDYGVDVHGRSNASLVCRVDNRN